MSLIAQKLISASGPKEATDDDFPLVTFLSHFDGTNGAYNHANTSFNSASSGSGALNPFPSAVIGQGTFSPFSSDEGKWSVSFDGTDDYLSLPNHSDFTFGSGNWTVEAFVNVDSIDESYKCIYSASYGVQFYVFDDKLHLAVNDTDNTSGYMIASFSTPGQIASAGVWYHVAAYRDGNNFYCSVDGAVSSMGSSSATIATPSAQAPSIGIWGNTSLPMNGYISNLRVIKGTALYGSSNFTAPSTPLTAVTNTKLLTCCSNRFRDKSTSAHTLTPSSTPKIQPFSPFAPSAAYDAAVNGGSVNFEAVSSGYVADLWGAANLSTLNFGTGDFTIEAWVYKKVDGEGTIYNGSYGSNQPILLIATNNKLGFYGGTTEVAISTSTVPLNSWTHVAVSRTSGTGYLLINGVQEATWSDSNNYPVPYLYYFIGCNKTQNGSAFVGNMSLRILNGTGLYTGAYTVPTSPFTDVTNTKILLNGAGGALFDQTGKNNLITVGNAQLDTSVKKFGTASAEFDGTGDYLKIPTSPLMAFGTSSYTIEAFVYKRSTGAQFIYEGRDNSDTSARVLFYVNESNKLSTYQNNAVKGTASDTFTLNQWVHVALVRSGTTGYLFEDGTQVATWSSDTTDLLAPNSFLYIGTYQGGGTTYDWDGFIDELRITKSARYTSNFTAPTKEFPNL